MYELCAHASLQKCDIKECPPLANISADTQSPSPKLSAADSDEKATNTSDTTFK